MYITGIEEIINVWSNDAHRLIVFINIFSIPFLLFIIYSLFEISKKRKLFFEENNNNQIRVHNSIEIIFIIITILNIISCIGIGQLILNNLIDSILRSIGLILLFTGFFLIIIYYQMNNKEEKYYYNNKKIDYSKNLFFSYIRYPDYLFLIMISLGISLTSINIFSFLIVCFVMIPLILNRIKKEENYIETIDNDYINYKKEIRMLIPSINKIIIKISKKDYN